MMMPAAIYGNHLTYHLLFPFYAFHMVSLNFKSSQREITKKRTIIIIFAIQVIMTR